MKNIPSSDPERLAYFHVFTAPTNIEDFNLQLVAVIELAKQGKDVSGFHYEIIPLLTTWLKQAHLSMTTARKQAGRQNRGSKSKGPLIEETNLALLFAFIVDIIKFSFNVSSEETTADLIEEILSICISTPLSSDLKACINVLDAIVTYGDIPGTKLSECVTVLCSIHCLVENVQWEAWRSIRNLCKSHNGQATTRILLDILRRPKSDKFEKEHIREIRGALSVLEKLFAKDGEKGYPMIPFTMLIDGLSLIIAIEHGKVEIDVLRLILSLFKDDGKGVKKNLLEEDWTILFQVASRCAQKALETPDGRPITSRFRVSNPILNDMLIKEETEQNIATTMAQTLYRLILRIDELLLNPPSTDFFQREECINFFVSVNAHLPDSCARIVIDHYVESRCCYPSDSEWENNIRLILEAFFADRSQPTHVRLHALKAVTGVFSVVDMMDEGKDTDVMQGLVSEILEAVGDEKDIAVLQQILDFVVGVAVTAEDPLFGSVLNAIRATVTSDRLQSPLGSPPVARSGLMGPNRPIPALLAAQTGQTPSNVVTQALVQLFMRTMDKSADKSLRIFGELLSIVKSHDCETDARISALRLLFRLRADLANRIFLTSFTESESLATCLYRTNASLAKKQAADEVNAQSRLARADDSASRLNRSTSFGQGAANGRYSARAASGIHRTVQRSHQMWMYPDQDALPDMVNDKASPLLVSTIEDEDQGVSTVEERTSMNIVLYLDTIIELLEHGCDWEVYSYVLVHLAAQLTNHAFFKAATSQINGLRRLLCEQVRNTTYHDPPLSSGLRKADVGICLFQILTMVVSYHEVFTKLEEDEIVRTLLQGMSAERGAKCCIHALSICCHELPASTSKALVTILQKMSQIITQTHVAVHILEFLTCLARLPNLFVNFREDEYRTVLAISFRYLHYIRDQNNKEATNKNSRSRNQGTETSLGFVDKNSIESNLQPSSSDDLPQYVYALAYQVIIFWFLNIKLPDRASQVSWVAKNVNSTDAFGRERMDEQSQVILDFMQRVTYADVDESAADPNFVPERFGKILKKTWIVGHSIITIEQATRGGWAQITKRQPSATSRYIIKQRFPKPPPHQIQPPNESARDQWHLDAELVLPSHLILQLASTLPQTAESLRPIALPDDDMIRRAISSFDRNATVDGHKVGVIYIGEYQTREAEILPNVTGSSDYVLFLEGLGTLTRLKGAEFNTQGLDREYDSDGEYTFCWRDRVSEIVFHVTTQMPTNLEHDPQCINKKRHIGNDYVNIIYNNSGLPFRFDTFPSDFNYVNIVITPESRSSFVSRRLRSDSDHRCSFYKVQVMSKPGFPEISPAAETKIVSMAALPDFVRLLALNACVFSLVWASRDGADLVSPWRNRLREIKRLREKYGTKSSTSMPASPPGTSNGVTHESRTVRESLNSIRRSSVANLNFLNSSSEPGSARSSLLSTAETEVGSGTGGEESLMDNFDFSKWA